MKKTTLVIGVMLLNGGLFAGTDQKPQPRDQKSPSRCVRNRVDNREAGKAAARATHTGSLIPSRLQVNGQITDGPSPLLVVDRAAINRSGANTVSQLLSQTGTRH